MWEDFNGKKLFHAQWLYRSAETVLGESGNPNELFLCDDCDNNPIGSIMEKCKVCSTKDRNFLDFAKLFSLCYTINFCFVAIICDKRKSL